MDLTGLENLLKNHDWYYDMSDDHRVWEMGAASKKAINLELEKLAENGLKKETMELFRKMAPSNAYLDEKMKISIKFF